MYVIILTKSYQKLKYEEDLLNQWSATLQVSPSLIVDCMLKIVCKSGVKLFNIQMSTPLSKPLMYLNSILFYIYLAMNQVFYSMADLYYRLFRVSTHRIQVLRCSNNKMTLCIFMNSMIYQHNRERWVWPSPVLNL